MDDNTKPSEVAAELRARAEKLRTGTNDQHTPAACDNGADTIERLQALAGEMAERLAAMTERYTSLVNCGDCGHWDPETEREVIDARASLQSYQEINK